MFFKFLASIVNLLHREFSVHLTHDQSILAPNFTVEVVNDNRIEPVDVHLNFYRGFLEGLFALLYTVAVVLLYVKLCMYLCMYVHYVYLMRKKLVNLTVLNNIYLVLNFKAV